MKIFIEKVKTMRAFYAVPQHKLCCIFTVLLVDKSADECR
jgi:hypothetical protein